MSAPTVAGDSVWGECAALLRDDFASFAACCFRELNPRARFAMNWHFEVMAGKLAAVRAGRIRRNGFVHLPKEAAWLAEYVHELSSVPRGKHDDQVDSTAQMAVIPKN